MVEKYGLKIILITEMVSLDTIKRASYIILEVTEMKRAVDCVHCTSGV